MGITAAAAMACSWLLVAQQGPAGPGGAGGTGGSGGGTQPDPAVTAILDAIDANLANLGGTITADFQCVDSSGNRTTTNGQLLAKGTDKLRMDFGSAGKLYVHDAREYNYSTTEQPGIVTGLRWDDPIGTSVDGAVVNVGAIDLRGLLRLARQRESRLTRAAMTETVNGVVCRKLETSDFTLWVEEGAAHRIIRARLALDSNDVGTGDFTSWCSVAPGAGELPSTWTADYWEGGTNHLWNRVYTISNASFGGTIDDSWFQTFGLLQVGAPR